VKKKKQHFVENVSTTPIMPHEKPGSHGKCWMKMLPLSVKLSQQPPSFAEVKLQESLAKLNEVMQKFHEHLDRTGGTPWDVPPDFFSRLEPQISPQLKYGKSLKPP